MGSVEFKPALKVRRNLVTALVSALFEWFLIFFLFIGAGVSYVITKFARDCELQTPCVLCSRLDHVLGEEKTGYHWDLMCKHHKSEISSLVHCHAHNKLVDVHKMCESCLFSFATTNKSNAETYRLLVGKLGEEFSSDSDHDDSPVEGENVGLLSSRKCGCCDQPRAPREHSRAKELIQTRFAGSEAGSEEPEMVFSDSVDRDHEVTRMVVHPKERERDHLPHIGYTELKINSDTESEAIHSDDDGASLVATRANFIHERVVEPRVVIVNKMDLALERLIDPEIEPRPSLLKSQVKEDEETTEFVDCRTREQESQVKEEEEEEETAELVDCETREQESEEKEDKETAELIDSETREQESKVKEDEETVQLVDYETREQESQAKEDEETVQLVDCEIREQESQVKHVEETIELVNYEAQEKKSKLNEVDEGIEQKTTVTIGHGLEELLWQEVGNEATHTTAPTEITIQPSLPSAQIATIVEVSQSSDVATRTIEVGETSLAKFEEVSERGALPNAIAETSDNAQQITTLLELGDAYKLAVDTRGKQFSGILADQWLGKDSSRVTDDLRILLSQLSANRGLDPPFTDVSPKLSVHSDDAKSLDHSNSFGMQRLQKRISLERNESGLSLDGSIISEIDGESGVDRLRRQLEHDKKLMAALYKELEEERSASAVATNQTMAMITRLQEEKAALHMEALQYLRMMEEQAEYDDDELQKSNDLLAEREKEVQDLEAELEFYRKKFPNERYFENISETSGDLKITDIGVDNSEQYNAAAAKLPELEDEKTFIAESLKKLEKTLDLLSDEDHLKFDCSEEHDTSVSGRNDKTELVEGNSTDLASVGVAVSGLNKRLEALEADRRFLEHTISSLRNGEEGVQCVQEIASHLRDLRMIAMRKDQTIA